MEIETIYDLTKRMERNLIAGVPIKIGKYATHDHNEKVATILAYLNSQHISGKTDSLGREKPFFNIIIMAVNTWYKATDIDTKHILFTARNVRKRMKALIATILFRDWMEKNLFGQWLNKWGYQLAAFGSSPTKFLEQNGNLVPSVISWDRIICDPIDFAGNPKIEKLFFTPAQLLRQPYDPEAVEEAIKYYREARTTLDNQKVDIQNDYIGVYEVHGDLPLWHLTKKERDKNKYRQQMHVIFMEKNPKNKKNIEISLFKGKEKQDPYYLSHLIEQEGRTLSIGAVEYLFDPQWMVNHSAKQIKDQLDLASKLVSQTSDPQFLGRNTLSEIDTGSILIHEEGKPLTPVNLQSHDIPNIMAQIREYKQLAREISGAHESLTGETMPSGTPFRLGALLNQEGMGLFELMRENKGLHLKEIIRKYVLPTFKKSLDNSDEVMALLEGEELETFDELALPANLEAELMTRLKAGEGRIPSTTELLGAIAMRNKNSGGIRRIKPSRNPNKTWKEYFSDIDDEKTFDIEITGESKNKAAIYETLNNLLVLLRSDPMIFADPNKRKILNKLIDEAGISPMKFTAPTSPMGTTGGAELPQMAAPSQVQVGVGAEV